MRTALRSLALCAPVLALVAAAPAPAYADIYLPDYPDAPESTCAARFEADQASCTITLLGRDFAVGASGSGAVRVVLEGPATLGVAPKVISDCAILTAMSGCVGATSYGSTPYPVGTQLTCRAYGLGTATFECSSFDLDG